MAETASPVVPGDGGLGMDGEPNKTGESDETAKLSEEEEASWFSLLFFRYLNRVLSLGADRPLQHDDLPRLRHADMAEGVAGRFTNEWERECNMTEKPSLLRVLWRMFRREFAVGAVWALLQGAAPLVSPFVIERFVLFLSSPSEPVLVGGLLSLVLLCSTLVFVIARNQVFRLQYRMGLRIHATLITAIFRKTLRLSNEARQSRPVGGILNLLTSDAEAMFRISPHLHMMWMLPLQLVCVTVLLLLQVGGWTTLAAVVSMCLFVPFNGLLARRMQKLNRARLGLTDERMKQTNDTLQNVRLLKYYTWEESFVRSILSVRDREMKVLRRLYLSQSFLRLVMISSPYIVMIVTFGTFVALGNQLTPMVAFVTVTLLNLLRAPMTLLPMLVGFSAMVAVTLHRVTTFLRLGERPADVLLDRGVSDGIPTDVVVGIWNGEFWWRTETTQTAKEEAGRRCCRPRRRRDIEMKEIVVEPPCAILRDINISVCRGQLAMIVGPVGSGKSSILLALLGDMTRTKGNVLLDGKVTYVGQIPWVSNATVRENIVMNNGLDPARYDKAVAASALGPDFESLPAGDETEIGERGITLSGGQKVRVALARAVYGDADIFLFDDVFSAVDAQVGRHIFDSLFDRSNGLLRGKTVILVTNQLQVLPHADLVVSIQEGKVAEMGTYEQLLSAGLDFAVLIGQHAKGNAAAVERRSADVASPAEEDNEEAEKEEETTQEARLVDREERMTGAVQWRVMWQFIHSFGGGLFLLFVLLGAVGTAASVYSQMWLAMWTDNKPVFGMSGLSSSFYLSVFAAIIGGGIVLNMAKEIIYVYGFLRCVRLLHEQLLRRVIRAPVRFFDTTPLGRILNRFSKDMFLIDEDLPMRFGLLTNLILQALSILVLMCVVTYWLPLVIVPCLAWFYFEQQFYRRSAREIQRLDSISKSPLFAHFAETVHGLTTIRALGLVGVVARENARLVDRNHRAFYYVRVASRWLDMRLSMAGAVIVTGACLLMTAMRDVLSPGFGGLVVSYAVGLTAIVSLYINNLIEVETRMTSVERVNYYSTMDVEPSPQLTDHRPPPDWPAHGELVMQNLNLRYRENLDLVLRDVSLHVRAGEHIGVVGRTGAGKSSLAVALFRMTEPEKGSGVQVDDVDLLSLGIHDARGALFIIPQTPSMFETSVRRNLDPMNKYSDEELWEVLERVQLKKYVEQLPEKMETVLGGHGGGLSAGQRQLVCVARALLRRPMILVLDEATACVDVETDALVQKAVREYFVGRVVITIAHRLNTVMDSSRVLVMEGGRIVESGVPADLLADSSSRLSALVDETGVENAAHLREMAKVVKKV